MKWILALSALTPVMASAQQAPQPEPTVITVTGRSTPVSAAPASVVVLPSETIEQANGVNAADLMRQVPFLYEMQSGARGGLTTITIRGGKPNFTLVMFDGIPMNDITNLLGGSYDFSLLSTDGVSQIEIVRGPLSSVYGSDAVAGVINIIPRRGEGQPSFEVGGTFGNFSTAGGNLAAFGKIRNFDYSLTSSYFGIGEQVKNDGYSLASLSLSSHLTFGSDKLLRFVARYQNGEASGFPPGGGGPEFSILQTAQAVHTIETITGLGWQQQVNKAWLFDTHFDFFDSAQNSNVPALADAVPPTFRSIPPYLTEINFKRYRFSLSNTVRLARNLSAEVGAGWRGEQGVSTGFLGTIPDNFSLTRDTGHVAGSLIYSVHGLTLTAGVRVDKTSEFRAVYSPRAGIAYRIRDRGPRLTASWGRGFKLPSFYALADKVVGNPVLRPEFSRSYDAGIENDFFHSHLRVGLTVFRNSYTDLVDFSAAVFRLVNRSQAQTQGVELALFVPVTPRLEFRAHTAYLDWTLKNTSEPLRNIPHWQSGGGVNWRIRPHWYAEVDAAAVGPRYDFQVPVPKQIISGGYSTASFATSYELSKAWTAFLRIDNVLNHHYHEFVGFPDPGIYVRSGFKYRFR